jgi:4-methyl-5(b-hydroxyethyl)-thiazole monophosphate biosynthesis
MNKIAVIVSKGYEDIELITTIDFFKRVKIDFDLISPENKLSVNGAHNAIVKTIKMENFEFNKYKSIFIPGGPAINNLLLNKKLLTIVEKF